MSTLKKQANMASRLMSGSRPIIGRLKEAASKIAGAVKKVPGAASKAVARTTKLARRKGIGEAARYCC